MLTREEPDNTTGSQPIIDIVVSDEMLEDFIFCPRLAHLKWAQGEIAPDSDYGDADGAGKTGITPQSSKTWMTWDAVGVSIGIERLEHRGGESLPVRTHSAASTEATFLEADALVLCLQGLVLRANSHLCNSGLVHYTDTEKIISIDFDGTLIARTYDSVFGLRKTLTSSKTPAPTPDENRCTQCQYAGICMPDEIAFIGATVPDKLATDEDIVENAEVRRLVPARDDGIPLYVQTQGAVLSKRDQTVEVRANNEIAAQVRLMDLSQVCIYGNVQITTQAVRAFCSRDIPICYFSRGGWFYGITKSTMGRNVTVRMEQYKATADPDRALSISKRFVAGKVKNCRTLLRRNCPDCDASVLSKMSEYIEKAMSIDNMATLLGIEGAAASLYFGNFGALLSSTAGFDFRARNRRPPKDPVNAVLSYLYSMLVKDLTIIALATGLDPYAGFYHQPLQGRPALALDLMEEFRPLICDSTAIRLINTSALKESDFSRLGNGVIMSDNARRKVISAYENRMDTLVTHPIFGYAISYRRVLSVQARLVARWLLGEINDYPPFCTR
ncbi:MAG: CRISPR-associated endonuclease Cas1 [Firmicutes bacterium]|nr:CRISPR-associated endonuclease Cas1 [Bacillota bacterium]